MENLGEKLIRLRKDKLLTQKELASKLNVSSQLISKWETGVAVPTVDYIIDICDFFEISVDEFLGREKYKALTEPHKKPMNPKLKTGLNVTLAVVECAIFLVATILVNYYGIFPAMLKNVYIGKIESAIERYIEKQQDFYNIQLTGSVDDKAVLSGYFVGKKQGESVTGEYYYFLQNNIREKVSQTSGKNVYDVTLYSPSNTSSTYNVSTDIENFTDLKSLLQFQLDDSTSQLNSTKLPTVSSESILDSSEYIRKTKDGFYVELSTDSASNIYGDDLADYKIPKKLKGSVRISDGVISKIQFYMNIQNKLSGEKSLVKMDMDFKTTEQEITEPQLKNYTIVDLDKKVDKAGFVNALGAQLTDISDNSVANNFLTNTPTFQLYNDKLYCVVTEDSALSLKVLNSTDLSLINSVELVTFKSNESNEFEAIFIGDSVLVFVNKNDMLYKINLDTLKTQSTPINYSLNYAEPFKTYKVGSNIILFNKDSIHFNYYEISLDPIKINLKHSFYFVGSYYEYDNNLYYEESSYRHNIYKYDVLNNQESTVGTCEDLDSILFVGKHGIVYKTTHNEIKIFEDSHVLGEYVNSVVITEDEDYLFLHYPEDGTTLKYQNGVLVEKSNIDTDAYVSYYVNYVGWKPLYTYQNKYYFSNTLTYIIDGEPLTRDTLNRIVVEELLDEDTKQYFYYTDRFEMMYFEAGNKVVRKVGKYLVLFDKNDLINPICYVEANLQFVKIADITFLKLDNSLYRM